MKKFLALLTALLLVLSFGALSACSDKGNDDGGDDVPVMTVVVSGRVVSGGDPVEGVLVTAVDSRDTEYGKVTTGADGKFSFENVAKTRAATLTFEKSGYFTKTVELTISDITSGKNAMGDVELESPSDFRTLTGKVVGLDGEQGIAGVTVGVKGFENTAVSGADGTFTMENVPLSSEGVTLTTSKTLYATVDNEIALSDIGADGNVGTIESYISIPAIDSSAAANFTLVRGETSLALYMDFDKNIGGGQNIQVMFHIGDNVSGKVYNTMCFADANHGITGVDFEGRDHVPVVRSIGKLVTSDFVGMTDEQFPTEYSYSTDDSSFVYEIPYTSMGMTKDDTIGVAILNVIFNGSSSGWVYPAFGIDMPADGTNVLNYQQFYDYDKDGDYTARAATQVKVGGAVKNEDGAPVSGATVSVTDEKGTAYESVTTGSDGKFEFEMSRLYPAQITVTKEGYSVATAEVSLADLQGASVTKDIVLAGLAGYATFTGSVENLLGGKIGGATVSVEGASNTVSTGADGTYTLENAPVGEEGITLIYSATAYTTISVNIPIAEIEMDGSNAVDTVQMYNEFGGNGHTKFSVVREETGLRFVFQGVSFTQVEIYWAEILVNDTVYAYALQPSDSIQNTAWGIDTLHPRFTRSTVGENTAWGAVSEGNDTWTPGGGANVESVWFVPYSEIGMEAGDTFGFAVAPILFAGHPNCIAFGYNLTINVIDPTFNAIAPEHFYMYGAQNNFTVPQA